MIQKRKWRKYKSGMIRRVDFALGSDIVRLISTFVYQRSTISVGGRCYMVESIRTGRGDIVGIEYLNRI